MQNVSQSSVELNAMIKAAIEDEKISVEEREKILMLADADGIIDAHERALLNQLQAMIQNGSVELVP
jgi:uncharacterized membrane protein YebE (DUF533 family)